MRCEFQKSKTGQSLNQNRPLGLETGHYHRCEGLLIRGRGQNARPSWVWDGNRERPTFSPSINCQSCPGRWHGFIEKGRCVNQQKQDEPEPK